MRSTRAAAALLPCAGVLAVGAPAAGPSRSAHPRPKAYRVPAVGVLVVGDSLGRDLRPFLARDVREDVVWNVSAGRTTPQGLFALRASLTTVHPQTVVLSLGSNDGGNPVRFARRVQRALKEVPARTCIVWTTIHRPHRKGPYKPLNHVLRLWAAREPRLTLVDWDRVVARGAVALPDGLHPDTAGFRLRSRLVAGAVRRGCRPAT
jgi:lysophospholipase L1-like esterase